MLLSHITLVLAMFCLTKLSLSIPLPKPQEEEPLAVDHRISPELDIGAHVGCGDDALAVEINTLPLPLIPCMKTQNSLQTSDVKLPLVGRNIGMKRAGSLGPMTAIDSYIPRWSTAITIASTMKARKIHTHHRTSLSPTPPATIIIEPLPPSTRRSKTTHTHHRFSKTIKSIKSSSVHPQPLPAQTLTQRWETRTNQLTTYSHTSRPTFTWISPPQTRFPITRVGPISIPESTTLATKVSAGTSRKAATWHPPAESLYPPYH